MNRVQQKYTSFKTTTESPIELVNDCVLEENVSCTMFCKCGASEEICNNEHTKHMINDTEYVLADNDESDNEYE